MSADLEALEAAREAAWRELDAAERAIPDCPHVHAWRDRIDAAREAHRQALRAAEAARGADPRPASMLQPCTFSDDGLEPSPQLEGQEALFELGIEAA